MPKLIVCGDSFMSPVVNYPGTHFSEIVAKNINYELIAHSRGGMSNGGIAVQIESAISRHADFILVGISYYDRVEFPINVMPETAENHIFTVEDIQYKHLPSLSSHYSWLNKKPRLTSTPIRSYLDSSHNAESPRKKALSLWFRYLYDSQWKQQTDLWIMYAVLHKLHLSEIPYLICFDQLGVVDTCPWLSGSVHNIVDSVSNILLPMPVEPPDPGYHTSVETQAKAAEFILSHISDNFTVKDK